MSKLMDWKGRRSLLEGTVQRHLECGRGIRKRILCQESTPPAIMIPYVAGMSKDIRRVRRKFDIRVVFKSGQTLRSMLTNFAKVKDTLPKQSNVVNRIPCSCGQVYIGETKQRLDTD